MRDSRRYRGNAADCLRAGYNAREPHYKKLNLLMAKAWLSLASQDDATDGLLVTWEAEDSAEKTTIAFVERLIGIQIKPPAPSVSSRSREDEQASATTDRRRA
jgi:hypothetical protein